MQVHAREERFFAEIAGQTRFGLDELLREIGEQNAKEPCVDFDADGFVRGLNFFDFPGFIYFKDKLTLDLSPLERLEELRVFNIDLELRFENPALKRVDISFCSQSRLALPPQIEELECPGNPLRELDASAFPALRKLNCCNSALEELDVSMLRELEELRCGWSDNGYYRDGAPGPRLTRLVLGELPKLKRLSPGNWLYPGTPLGQRLRTIDVRDLSALETLDVSQCELQALDLSGNRQLRGLSCWLTPLTELDLGNNPKLESINVQGTALSSLDLSAQPALRSLSCGSKQLASLSLRGARALRSVYCDGGAFRELDISDQPELERLSLERCKVEALDLRANTKLRELELKGCRQLATIHCSEQQKQVVPGLRKFFKLSKPTRNPAKMDVYTLHEFVQHYNWDDGLRPMLAAVRNPSCCLATALTVYWRASPYYFLKYATDAEARADISGEAIVLIREIERRALDGQYRNEHIEWIPGDEADDPDPGGPRKRAIPEHMIRLSATKTSI